MPRGSMLKYFNEQGGRSSDHGGPISWPGTADGFPFRGPVPDLSQEEYENVPLALDYRSDRFRLWVAEDKTRFDAIMDRIVNGWFMQHKRFDFFVEEEQHHLVLLEWVQIYGETPIGKHPGVHHGQQAQVQPGQPALQSPRLLNQFQRLGLAPGGPSPDPGSFEIGGGVQHPLGQGGR